MIKIDQMKFEIDEQRRSILYTVISNAPHFTRKDKKPSKPIDFYESKNKVEHEQTAEEIEEMFLKMYQRSQRSE